MVITFSKDMIKVMIEEKVSGLFAVPVKVVDVKLGRSDKATVEVKLEEA